MLGYNSLLSETCEYERYTGTNKFNEKTYDLPILLECFTSTDFSNIRGINEQSITSSMRIFISNDFEPNPKDKAFGKEIKIIKPVKGLVTPILGWEIVI